MNNFWVPVPMMWPFFQKLAYCHQQDNQWEQALKFYLQADLMLDDNHLTKKKIALCYLKLKKTTLALDYYQAAEKSSPSQSPH